METRRPRIGFLNVLLLFLLFSLVDSIHRLFIFYLPATRQVIGWTSIPAPGAAPAAGLLRPARPPPPSPPWTFTSTPPPAPASSSRCPRRRPWTGWRGGSRSGSKYPKRGSRCCTKKRKSNSSFLVGWLKHYLVGKGRLVSSEELLAARVGNLQLVGLPCNSQIKYNLGRSYPKSSNACNTSTCSTCLWSLHHIWHKSWALRLEQKKAPHPFQSDSPSSKHHWLKCNPHINKMMAFQAISKIAFRFSH